MTAINRQPESWSQVFRTAWRLITFQASHDELIGLGWRHFLLGLSCTWLVGMGRYWDNPRVGLLQHLGVGSVVYIFVLSLFLFLLIAPLRPQHWSLLRLVTFISLVSPPAVLYAVPVEKFLDLDSANSINLLFLVSVATWRVALLIFFLRRLGEMRWVAIVVATLLPLTIIVVTLTMLNLDKVVFDAMGGGGERSPNDAAYSVLFLLSLLSILLFIPLLIAYLALLFDRIMTARYHVTDDT